VRFVFRIVILFKGSSEPERQEVKKMKSLRKIAVVVLVVASLLVFTTKSAKAEYCCFNPLALPFMVAGAVVGTAAAITTGILGFPFYAGAPYYYSPSYYGPGYYGPRYYGSSYYGPGYYGSGHYGPYAPVSFYFGSGYSGYNRGYYGRGPRWGGWGHGYHHRYGGGAPRYHGRAAVAGSGRSTHAGYRVAGR
jgi:hypothetical protein